jgi:predicted RNase H-like nuclease (RuvC/YqgF family)
MKRIYTLITCALLISPILSWADDSMVVDDETQTTLTNDDVVIDPNCLDSSDVCFNRAVEKEKLVQQCVENPVWCEQRRERMKQRREARQALKAQCEAQPEQCEQLTQTFKEQQKQLVESQRIQWCTDNPQRCQQWEADQKALREQCQTLRRQLTEKYTDRP